MSRSGSASDGGATVPRPPEPEPSWSHDTLSGLRKNRIVHHFVKSYLVKSPTCVMKAFPSRLAQLSGVDIPRFMMSRVPSSPGPCMDTSIFSMRGYRAL